MHTMSIKLKKILSVLTFLAAALIFVTNLLALTSAHRIENAAVAAFIDEVTYREDEKSLIAQYAPEGSARQDKPAELVISYPATDGEVRLVLSSKESKYYPADTRTLSAEGSIGQIALTNLLPDTAYTYSVESDEGQIANGAFNTSGQVRMLDIDGVFNVRDLGGWKTSLGTSFGKRLAYGKIFRGSELTGEHGITIFEAGVKALRDAGIGFELDLRGDDEVDLDGTGEGPIVGTVLGEGIGYERIPIVAYLKHWTGKEDDPTGQERGRYYEALRVVFDCVRQGRPVYIHCWGGADRTGTLCLLIEGLLGVSESDFTKEYELTTFAQEFGRRSKNSRDYKAMVAYIKGLEGETLAERFESFFLELGFTEEEIEEFRERMIA